MRFPLLCKQTKETKMTIRNGMYAQYENLELKLVEARIDVPVPEDQKTFQIWYPNLKDCPFEDFERDRFDQGFYKTIPISQIEKAFLINTFGKCKKLKVEVFKGKGNKVQIASRNLMIAEELNLIKVGKEWYMKEVEISNLNLIWEEKVEIIKSESLYGEILKLNEIWNDKIERMKMEK